MVITRQQNATAEANPSGTKFTKEQNDFKIKELQEYSVNKSLDQYHLNLYGGFQLRRKQSRWNLINLDYSIERS